MTHKVVIVGAGALGSHVALFARNWNVEFTVIDFDRVEMKNTQSQFHTQQGLRANKAFALHRTLSWMFQGMGPRFKAVPHKLDKDNIQVLLGGSNLVLDCTDNAEVRKLIQGLCLYDSIHCLHGAITNDGTFGQVMWTEDFHIDEDVEGDGATCEDGEHLPFLALVSAQITSAAQRFLKDGTKHGYHVTPTGIRRVT